MVLRMIDSLAPFLISMVMEFRWSITAAENVSDAGRQRSSSRKVSGTIAWGGLTWGISFFSGMEQAIPLSRFIQ
jgi:hypothetical protein